jgi:hypothetical protein
LVDVNVDLDGAEVLLAKMKDVRLGLARDGYVEAAPETMMGSKGRRDGAGSQCNEGAQGVETARPALPRDHGAVYKAIEAAMSVEREARDVKDEAEEWVRERWTRFSRAFFGARYA